MCGDSFKPGGADIAVQWLPTGAMGSSSYLQAAVDPGVALESFESGAGVKAETLNHSKQLSPEQLLLKVRTQLESGVQPGLIAVILHRDGYHETLEKADQLVRSVAHEVAGHRRT